MFTTTITILYRSRVCSSFINRQQKLETYKCKPGSQESGFLFQQERVRRYVNTGYSEIGKA
jgi:hypothetical protein